jgi:hypothetical protein
MINLDSIRTLRLSYLSRIAECRYEIKLINDDINTLFKDPKVPWYSDDFEEKEHKRLLKWKKYYFKKARFYLGKASTYREIELFY